MTCQEALRWRINRFFAYRPFYYIEPKKRKNPKKKPSKFHLLTIGEILLLLGYFACFIVGVIGLISNIIGKNKQFGKNAGMAASILFSLAWLFSLRHTIWNYLFGFSYERGITIIHRKVPKIGFLIIIMHGISMRDYILTYRGTMGLLTGISVFLIIISSFDSVRKKYFNLFLITHWLFSLMFIIFSYLHGAMIPFYTSLLIFGDLLLRVFFTFIDCKNENKNVQIKNISLISENSDVIRLVVDIGNKFKYDAGQYVFICIPDVSCMFRCLDVFFLCFYIQKGVL